jgi:DNA gyrase inhibitor GyrI
MAALDVRIIELPVLRVASTYGFGASPEMTALEHMRQFLLSAGLWKDVETLQLYGFNNPDPEPDNPEYGYEQWVVVPEDVKGTDQIEIKSFSGGLYAVSRCEGTPNIYRVWHELQSWQKVSSFDAGAHQWLERWINPTQGWLSAGEMVMDLYLPIVKQPSL